MKTSDKPPPMLKVDEFVKGRWRVVSYLLNFNGVMKSLCFFYFSTIYLFSNN